MLGEADAALMIGDPALRLDPATLPFETLDLGGEWTRHDRPAHGLRGVGRAQGDRSSERYARAFLESCRYGLAHMDDIVASEAPARGVTEELAREYLTQHIVFELGERDYAGPGSVSEDWRFETGGAGVIRHDDARGSDRPVSAATI